MERVEAPTTIQALAPPIEWATDPLDVYGPNFGLLASDNSWRTTWSTIIAGKFSPSPYSGVLFVERSTAYAELYETDGHGRLRSPYLGRFDPLGGRTSWTHVVPGFFGPSGFTGLLLYDRGAGYGRLYDSDGHGGFVLLREYTGWRTSWTHVVAGRFVVSSPYSSLFFYDAAEKYGEIWATDGKGLAGALPDQELSNFSSFNFTHIVAGDFHWTPGYIDSVPTLTDLFCYDGTIGRGEMYRCGISSDGAISSIVLTPAATSDSLPRQAISVTAGNFGGLGNTDLAFYDGPAGSLALYSFKDLNDTSADIVLREIQPGLRSSVGLVVPGTFSMSNPDDHWFGDGPAVSGAPPYCPNWRFGTGAFSDLLLYDQQAGLGEFYFHEPLAPPIEPLEGYITSQTAHGGSQMVATGSVLPGESIAFHVSSQCGPYSIAVYQQGVFDDGTTEQWVATIEGLPSDPTPLPVGRTAYRDGAGWAKAATFVIPAWPSALYLARVKATGASYEIDLPFVVRAPSGAEAGILMVLADTTYHAYNDWGGRNLYGSVSGSDFAGAFPSTSAFRIPFGFQLSFERPFHGGFGNSVQAWELPFMQWLGRRHIAVDICTARDLHFGYLKPTAHRLVLFAGHHEYWTAEMRTNVEVFVKSKGNAAFFSGNVCWWQMRLTPDGRQLTCYKVAGFDPLAATAQHGLTTVHWFDALVNRPETTLTGVSWRGDAGIYYDEEHRFVVKQPDHWVFAGTGLRGGDTFGGYSHPGVDDYVKSVAGPETDRVQNDRPNGLISPANYTLASIYDLEATTFEVGTMGIFSPEGAAGQVFNAATINWALGLSQNQDDRSPIDRITTNVISKLGGSLQGWEPWSSVSEGKATPGGVVTAVVTGLGEVALFLAGPSGGVYTASGSASNWGPWGSVSEGQTTPGGVVTAVVTGPDEVTLFLADPGGGVYTASGNAGSWGPWSSVSEGQTAPGGVVTAVVTGPGEVALFLADLGGGVYTASGSAGSWRPWGSVSEGQTTPIGVVTAIVTGPSEVALFLADPGGGVYTASEGAGSWGPWESVSEGQTMPGGVVTAVVTGPGEMALFLADPSGGVYTASGSAGSWGPWETVSEGKTTPGGMVTAVVTGPGEVALFLADPGGDVYTASGSAGSWGPWGRVSEGKTTPGGVVTAVVTGPGEVALFLADPEGGIYTTTKR